MNILYKFFDILEVDLPCLGWGIIKKYIAINNKTAGITKVKSSVLTN